MVDTKYRSRAPEMMDDFTMEGEELRDALDKLAGINKLLGGNRVTLQGVKELIELRPLQKNFKIVDVGCGNGDMLRLLAAFAIEKSLNFELIGIDANAFTIAHAASLSAHFANISYRCEDIFQSSSDEQFDIVLCTLTLHHFSDQEIVELLRIFKKKTALGLVINDLHRSKLAYYLFQAVCFIFGLNRMSREDGLVSILRAFKNNDLKMYSRQLDAHEVSIRWKWAFRYQWIIRTYESKNKNG